MKKFILFLCLLTLSSCAMFSSPRTSCPLLSIIPDASFITKYEEGTNKIFAQGKIDSLGGYCQKLDERNLNVEGKFYIEANLAEVPQTITYVPFEYFIAILDEENNILQKNKYTKVIKFKAKQFSKSESVDFIESIKLKYSANIKKYNVLVSFQLTKKELEQNRNRSNPYK